MPLVRCQYWFSLNLPKLLVQLKQYVYRYQYWKSCINKEMKDWNAYPTVSVYSACDFLNYQKSILPNNDLISFCIHQTAINASENAYSISRKRKCGEYSLFDDDMLKLLLTPSIMVLWRLAGLGSKVNEPAVRGLWKSYLKKSRVVPASLIRHHIHPGGKLQPCQMALMRKIRSGYTNCLFGSVTTRPCRSWL